MAGQGFRDRHHHALKPGSEVERPQQHFHAKFMREMIRSPSATAAAQLAADLGIEMPAGMEPHINMLQDDDAVVSTVHSQAPPQCHRNLASTQALRFAEAQEYPFHTLADPVNRPVFRLPK